MLLLIVRQNPFVPFSFSVALILDRCIGLYSYTKLNLFIITVLFKTGRKKEKKVTKQSLMGLVNQFFAY